jgi:predicted transcriptional regulator
LDFLKVIEEIAGKIAPGRSPSFNETQIVQALEIINAHGTVGRIRLSKELGLGEGAVRTLLKHANNEGIMECSRDGIELSKYGKELFSSIRSRIGEGTEVPRSPLTVGPFNFAVLVTNIANRVRTGVEQRDAALRVGATGATTLVFLRNKLVMPCNGEGLFGGISSIQEILVSKLRPKENDVVIVGSGQTGKLAELGAKMAAIELLKTERQSIH